MLAPFRLALALALALALGARAADLETDALAAEARLDYDGAFDLYARLLLARAEPDAARDEVAILKLDFLAQKTGRWKELARALETVRAGLDPLAGARAAWTLARARLAAGSSDGAREALDGLGFIEEFALVGPFDNERGGGFAMAYDPEKTIDLEARYPGKVREIGWRPARAAFGKVDLDALFRPNDEALAYALAGVKWDGPAPRLAALRLGSDEGVKVFWNGEEVLARDVNRRLELDQDVVGVVLRPGWNRLLLKVAERKGPWAFVVRLTAPDGRPLEGWRAASAKEIAAMPPIGPALPAAAERPPSPSAGGKGEGIARGPIEPLEARARAGEARAEDFFRLGYLLYRRRAHDENAHPDREAFQRAAALDPKNPVYPLYLSFVSGEAGEFSVNREENARREALERALSLDPKAARAALLLADYYFRSLRQGDRAEAFVEKALAAAPRSLEARLLQLEIWKSRGWDALVHAELEALGKDPAAARDPQALKRLAEDAMARSRLAEAERFLGAALAIDRADERALELLLAVRKAQGRLEGALEPLDIRIALGPDVRAHLERARLLAAYERHDDAVAALEAALAIAPEDDEIHRELGRVTMLAGKREAALAHYGRALELNPGLVEVRKYLEFLVEGERPFEDEHRLDADETIAGAAAIPLDPEVSARTLLENVAVKVRLDGRSSEFTQEIVRIENDDGIQEWDHASVPYAVGEQRATILRATVVKPDGRREEARIEDGRHEGQGGEFTQYSRRQVDLPVLEVGDIVIFERRVDDVKQSFFGDYFGATHYFQRFEPVERSRYTLIVPQGRSFYFNPRRLPVEPTKRIAAGGAEVVWTWEMTKVPKIEQEPNMPPYDEVAPCIQVSTFRDWNAFARWYWNLIRKQQEVSDEMRAKVEELTWDAKTREDRIRAIYEFVVTDVRYNDKWEFGVHGFKPYNAASIFTRRFGDCKDKATLICTMLGVAGVPAYPVLISGESRRGEEDLSLPLMNHFNHCIAFVPGPAPGGGDGWFLDGTAQDHPAEDLPNMDYGATCLVVTPEGGELRRVKWPDPLKENGIAERHRVALERDGGGTIAAEIEPRGIYAAFTRGQFANEGERRELLEKIYGRAFAGAAVEAHEWSDLKNLREPVRVRFRLKVPRLVKEAAGGFELEEVPSVLFEWLYAESMSELATSSERKWDVVLPVPSGVEEAIEYELPPGYTVKHLPRSTRLENELGEYVKSYETKGNVLRVTRKLAVKAQRIPVAKYATWREFATAVDRADDEKPVLGKGGLEE